MKKKIFKPIDINDAGAYMVAEYGYYCQEKFEMDEIPFRLY